MPSSDVEKAKEIVADWDAHFTYKLNISVAGIDLLTDLISQALTSARAEGYKAAFDKAILMVDTLIPDQHTKHEPCSDCAIVRLILHELKQERDANG